MSDYKIRTTRLSVVKDDSNLFSEVTTHVEIDDEAAGEFVKVTQQFDDGANQAIVIEPQEWPSLKDAIEQMIKECRL
jgi:hypothetical protein